MCCVFEPASVRVTLCMLAAAVPPTGGGGGQKEERVCQKRVHNKFCATRTVGMDTFVRFLYACMRSRKVKGVSTTSEKDSRRVRSFWAK